LYVNQFIASEARWRDRSVTIRQETRLPDDDLVRLILTCAAPTQFRLAVRSPRWATGGMTVRLNGQMQPVTGQPGSYLVLERTWASGDVVELRIPLAVRRETMPDNPRRVAFFKGPILLAGDLGTGGGDVPVLVPDDRPLPTWLDPVPGRPLELRLAGVGRPRDVPLVPFFRLPSDDRYVVYWDVLTPEAWSSVKAARDAAIARLRALDARTIDQVVPGEAASETAHHLAAHQSNTGRGAYNTHMETRWRDAPGGWFSYELKVVPDTPVALLATYWGKERGARVFDIRVDNEPVATTSLDSSHPAEFYDLTYPVPRGLTAGKTHVTVKFQAHPGNTAGGLFGLRVVRP
jgi:hypothetical protein